MGLVGLVLAMVLFYVIVRLRFTMFHCIGFRNLSTRLGVQQRGRLRPKGEKLYSEPRS